MANDAIEFKYSFSDKFYYLKNPLEKKDDQHFDRVKEAIEKACKLWEKATRGNLRFSLTNDHEDADIIFEGWSEKGPKVSSENDMICIDEYNGKHLFSDYMPEALGFTIFEDCNTACEYPETCAPANASINRRARIFFHIKNVLDKAEPWFYESDKNRVPFTEAERDVTRVAAQEIGHALGFCGYPDKVAHECPQTPECDRGNASIMCKNQARCYQEDQNGEVPLGGMDDIDDLGIRDLSIFDKKRIVNKYFSGTKTLYGRVQDADGNPIPNAVVVTEDEKLTARTDSNGRYSLWRIPPGTYAENGKNPDTGQTIGETITITPAAPDVIIKDFNFIRSSQKKTNSSRIIPLSETPKDTYALEATFPGVYPDHSASIKLYIDGKELHSFSIPPANQQPIIVYSYYSLSGLSFGSHTYGLKASKQEGDWQQILYGSFKTHRPSNIQLDIAPEPTTVSVGKNNHTTIKAHLHSDKGVPFRGETIIFRTSFPGYFTPSNGEAITNLYGQAEVTFTPTSSGRATVTAIPSYGPSASTTINCTSPVASISFERRPLGNNAYEVTSRVDYTSDKKPAAGDTIKWRLTPSTDLVWTKGHYKKLDKAGKAKGVFSVRNPEIAQVTITVTHIPTGSSGSGTFPITDTDTVRILPWKNLKKSADRCERSANGYFGVGQKSGTNLSLYRISDWKRIWNKTFKRGKYRSFFFSPNGKRLVASIMGGENKITILNVPSGSIHKSWNIHSDGASSAADKSFGWQGDNIYAVHHDNTIRKWSATGNLQMSFRHNAEIEEIRFNPADDSQFAAVDKYGTLKIWNTDSAAPVKTVKVESMPTGRLKCLAWDHDGNSISVGSGIGDAGVIYTFDTASWSKSGFDLPGLGNVNSLDYNSNSSRLAIGHNKGLIVYNANKQAIEYFDKGPVQHVRWSPDKSMLAADGQIYLFGKQSFKFPKIRIFSPQNRSSFMTDTIEITGNIRGRQKIRSATMSINKSKPIALSLLPDGSFTQKISLRKDQNTIFILVQDVQRNTSAFTFTVNRLLDSVPPTLTEPYVDADTVTEGAKLNVSVRVHDGESGVDPANVAANIRSPSGNLLSKINLYDDGSNGDIHPGDGVYETLWASSKSIEGMYFIDFLALDRADNSGKIANNLHFYVYNEPLIKAPILSPPSPFLDDAIIIGAEITDTSGVKSAELLYSTNRGRSWDTLLMANSGPMYSSTIPAQTSETVYYKIKAADIHGYMSESDTYAYRIRDNTRPAVTIQKPATISKTFTSEPRITVSGQAIGVGGVGLKSITCSTGVPNLGTLGMWSFNLFLRRGPNVITIVAEDQNGRLGSDAIEITYAPQVAALEFLPAAPYEFEDQLPVTIQSSEKAAIIHYTIDNTDPTEASQTYSSPILINKTTTIKARAFMPNRIPSVVSAGTYTLTPKKKAKPVKHLTLQVAAFKDKKLADDMIERLKAKGYPAYSVTGTPSGNVTYYKVRIGSFGDMAEAETMLNKIKKEKLEAIVVVNERDSQ
ncbi:MAG: SPOR domain-containing protein [Desulfobacterales bacterium]|nr:MAG: SPOR domain-containing protein [Desulfobacterales bacterium]